MAELDLIKAESSALMGRCSSIMRISSVGRSSNSILEIKKGVDYLKILRDPLWL
jgi:hypothetical protein